MEREVKKREREREREREQVGVVGFRYGNIYRTQQRDGGAEVERWNST